MEQVLVLDANTRSALAATRSLGRRGLYVVVADKMKHTLSGSSKYCSDTFTYPPADKDPEGFVKSVTAECSQRGIRVIFPMTEVTTATVLKQRESMHRLKVPFVRFDAFEQLTDKWRLFGLAQRLHLSIPTTHFVSDTRSLARIYPSLVFPVVLKPHHSYVYHNGRWISASVKYASSISDLEDIVARYEYFRQPFLIQEYVLGEAQGIFALYDHGQPVVFFAHRRLRERPPRGGVSVLSESIEPNPEAQRISRALLDYVGWHGVAMVEFKVSADGTPYLIEVNGRFWGSLQLAIDAGVDFPWLLYQLATGMELDKVYEYATGMRCRWLLGDFASLCKVLINNDSPSSLPRFSKVRSVLQFLTFFDKRTRYEINRWDDVRPCMLELGQLLRR